MLSAKLRGYKLRRSIGAQNGRNGGQKIDKFTKAKIK
jgi:hypothetical protein